jgi:glycosyltransferase involved in cell wall biosynthesis
LVIPPNQTRDLTKALDILLNNPSLRETMRANALERAKNYTDHKMIETLQQLYKEILGE